jgi:hypothetical protein
MLFLFVVKRQGFVENKQNTNTVVVLLVFFKAKNEIIS